VISCAKWRIGCSAPVYVICQCWCFVGANCMWLRATCYGWLFHSGSGLSEALTGCTFRAKLRRHVRVLGVVLGPQGCGWFSAFSHQLLHVPAGGTRSCLCAALNAAELPCFDCRTAHSELPAPALAGSYARVVAVRMLASADTLHAQHSTRQVECGSSLQREPASVGQ
jgi:hypothetical protein